MEEEFQRKGNAKRAAIIIGGMVVFIIIAFIVYFTIDSAAHKIQITNDRSGEFAVFTRSDFEHIQDIIKSYLKYAYKMSDSEISEVKMTIREGSVEVDEHDGEKFVNFIIDLDSPRLTYTGTLTAGGPDEETFLACAPVDKMQDKSVFCVGHDRESTITMALGQYLPYDNMDELEEGEDGPEGAMIRIEEDYDEETGLPELVATVGACEKGEDGKAAREFVEGWIREKGNIDPGVLPLKYIYADCSGGPVYVDDRYKPED